jgi:hypothetical protein
MTRGSEPADWRWHAGALVLYAGIAWIVIVHGRSLTGEIAGWGSDPYAFIWLLAWWPWAVMHHLDPMYTRLVWQPLGLYLPWVASLPLLSLIGAPTTLIGGPVLTFNLMILCAPVLSAWMAYFLCLRISGSAPAAVIGGYLFGFSAYEMAQDVASLNLSVTLIVPALLIVVLKRLDGELGRAAAVSLAAALLVCQFLIGTELFAMIFVFGGIAWGLALAYLPARRGALWRLAWDGVLAGPIVVLAVSPFLVVMFGHLDYIHLPDAWPYFFAGDLLNVVVPTRLEAVGGAWCEGLTRHFSAGLQEEDGYLGLPLLLIVVLFARENAARPTARMLVALFLIALLASFGPRLWVGGHYTNAPMPWTLFLHVPLIGSALPARFALFVSLAASVIAAQWVAQGGRRLALGLAACLALMPALHPWKPAPHSRFFQPGEVQAALGANATVLVLPFALNGPSSFWQQEAGFSFAQTGGYLGFPPRAMQSFPVVGELFGNMPEADFQGALRSFCQATATRFVVAGPGTSGAFLAELAALNWKARRVDDVTVYTVPLEGEAHG